MQDMTRQQINLRATTEQIRYWRAKAAEVRRTLSDWMRLVLDDASVPTPKPRHRKAVRR
jgi:uncharacterized protein (DUF1778 family)